MSLRLLNHWPWGCVKTKADLPDGNFQFAPADQNYWLTGSLPRVMRWYYRVKTWEFTMLPLFNGSPDSSPLSVTHTFGDYKEVVCGRRGIRASATLGAYSFTVYLFTPHPIPDAQPLEDLLNHHSVIFDENTYKVFCLMFVARSTGTGGFRRATNIAFHRPEFEVSVDGSKILEATAAPLGFQWLVTARPVEFFDFTQ
jgi:hypothetical protein